MNKNFAVLLLLALFLFFTETIYANELTTPSGISLSDVERFVDDYVNEYIGETTAGASIVILKDNKVVLSKGYGYGDIENQIKINPNTAVFEWGSVSKLFVWVSVMQLVEQGKIDLDEDINSYLPQGFLTKLTYDDPITMLDLMNHTAGFEENIFDTGYATESPVKSLEEGLKIAEPNQVYRPGKVVAYSNYSTSLAAYIVQLITEQDFNEYVDEHIFQKLGILDSTAYLSLGRNEQITKNKVNGYELIEKGSFKLSTPYYMSMYPSGGINGTAQDLAKFAMALMPQSDNENVLFEDENTLVTMLSQSYAINKNVPGIAHGFWEYDGKFKGLTHGGNTVSFSSNFHIVPEENFAVIIVTNQASEYDISYGLTKELVGEKEIDEGKLADLPNSQITEGKYLTTRRMNSGFLNLYYYLQPLTVKSLNANEIEVSLAGMKANYVQTSPNVYKMTKGSTMFIPTNVLYFSIKDGEVKQISTSISDYLPFDKSISWLSISAVLFIYCLVYFSAAPFVLIVISILNWRRKKPSIKIKKWVYLLNVVGTAFIVNIILLAIRMLSNSDRGYFEVFPHIVANYVLTIASLVFIIFILVNWKKATLMKLQRAIYLLSIVTIVILIFLLITWQFYS
ncbi:MAG TPA: serine hydrolase [Sporosarcina psychrophila]|uniref:Serine hydrolase n=1 Tax=Sporosarcina psychrophila TaxID=1476 RepID=A0A921FZS7_SPOPS|nr:serine hydrolase [Sporosarcina psychrophila]